MTRKQALAFRLVGVAFALAMFNSTIVTLRAQAPAAPTAPAAPAAKPAAAAEEEEDPFAPQPVTPLPPGMTGSTTNDPRVGLKPGLYDAGEVAMGMEHLAFLKKADAFQLPATQPDDPVTQKTLDILGVNKARIPKPMQLVIAQLAFRTQILRFRAHTCSRATSMA